VSPEHSAVPVQVAGGAIGDFATIVDVLSTSGPWALVVVLSFVVWKLYAAKDAQATAFAREKQELNDRMLEIAKEQTAVIVSNTENVKKLTQAIRPLLED
jgi:hypothetical protein